MYTPGYRQSRPFIVQETQRLLQQVAILFLYVNEGPEGIQRTRVAMEVTNEAPHHPWAVDTVQQ